MTDESKTKEIESPQAPSLSQSLAIAIAKDPTITKTIVENLTQLIDKGWIKSRESESKRSMRITLAIIVLAGITVISASWLNWHGTMSGESIAFLFGTIIGLIFAFLGRFLTAEEI